MHPQPWVRQLSTEEIIFLVTLLAADLALWLVTAEGETGLPKHGDKFSKQSMEGRGYIFCEFMIPYTVQNWKLITAAKII